jgi:protein-tyrosine-phosphatase
MKYILFVCVGNVGRSQMAEGFFNYFSKNQDHTAISAGVNAANRMSDIIVDLMKEDDIDISSHKPKHLTADMVENALKIISLGDDVRSDFLQVRSAENWHMPDPVHCKSIDEVREIREKIKNNVLKLISKLENGKS